MCSVVTGMGVKERNLSIVLCEELEDKLMDVRIWLVWHSKDNLPSTSQSTDLFHFGGNQPWWKKVATRWRYISLNIYSSVFMKGLLQMWAIQRLLTVSIQVFSLSLVILMWQTEKEESGACERKTQGKCTEKHSECRDCSVVMEKQHRIVFSSGAC